MKVIRKPIIILAVILFIAAVLRLVNLGSYPALNADEASIGYNAFSLLLTGKDEHGNPWPLHFQSFNDYKPGLYFYLAMPFIYIFGLNEVSVRLPNALFAIISVIFVYLLSGEVFVSHSKRSYIQLLSAFVLAISPWHIHFSRGAWEVNVATSFILAGVVFFLKFTRNKSIWALIASGVFFVLSLYTYHAARVVLPLLLVGVGIIYRRILISDSKKLLIAFLICSVFILPLLNELKNGSVFSRVSGVGLFSDIGPFARTNEQRGEHKDYQALWPTLLHNKVVNYGLAFLANWGKHFHGEFLFLSGDIIQRNRVPETGQMYIFDIVTLAIGMVWILRRLNKGLKLVLWWLIVSPFAAAFTFQSPHALRAQNMVIPLSIVSGLGLFLILENSSKLARGSFLLRSIFVGIVFLVIGWGLARYQHMYWIHMAKEYKYSSQYGVKELVNYVRNDENKYRGILVTSRYDQPYILFLFYLGYPPDMFQYNHTLTPRDKYGFSTVEKFDKYEFRSIDFDKERPRTSGYLIAGTPEEIPDEANIVKRIYGSNGLEYFEVVAN